MWKVHNKANNKIIIIIGDYDIVRVGSPIIYLCIHSYSSYIYTKIYIYQYIYFYIYKYVCANLKDTYAQILNIHMTKIRL